VFGDNFNAIEGNPPGGTGPCAALTACSPDGHCPTGRCVDGLCPCAIDNPALQDANQRTNASRIRIKAVDDTVLATIFPDAVTPTMLAFRMPFDCFAPLGLEVAKRDGRGVEARRARLSVTRRGVRKNPRVRRATTETPARPMITATATARASGAPATTRSAARATTGTPVPSTTSVMQPGSASVVDPSSVTDRVRPVIRAAGAN